MTTIELVPCIAVVHLSCKPLAWHLHQLNHTPLAFPPSPWALTAYQHLSTQNTSCLLNQLFICGIAVRGFLQKCYDQELSYFLLNIC